MRTCIECGKHIVGKYRCHACNQRWLKAAVKPSIPSANACADGGGHHWLIDPPNGSDHLPAHCRKCGEIRTFFATLGEAPAFAA